MFMIRAVFYIEAQSNVRSAVEGSLRKISLDLEKEENLRVLNLNKEDIIYEDGLYSGIIEAEIEFFSFKSYILNAIKYAPSAIEVLEPKRLKISASELIDVLAEVIKLTKMFYMKHNVMFKIPEVDKEYKAGLSEDEIYDLLSSGAIHIKLVFEIPIERHKSFLYVLSQACDINKFKSNENMIAVEVFADVLSLFDIAVKYTPILVSILEPEEITINIVDLRDIALDVTSIFFEASQRIAVM